MAAGGDFNYQWTLKKITADGPTFTNVGTGTVAQVLVNRLKVAIIGGGIGRKANPRVEAGGACLLSSLWVTSLG